MLPQEFHTKDNHLLMQAKESRDGRYLGFQCVITWDARIAMLK